MPQKATICSYNSDENVTLQPMPAVATFPGRVKEK